jgi:hypothetical protein
LRSPLDPSASRGFWARRDFPGPFSVPRCDASSGKSIQHPDGGGFPDTGVGSLRVPFHKPFNQFRAPTVKKESFNQFRDPRTVKKKEEKKKVSSSKEG